MAGKVKIELFVTKSWKFRAKITPHDKDVKPFEITVGGENWKHIGPVLKKQILDKCGQLLAKLNGDFARERAKIIWLDK